MADKDGQPTNWTIKFKQGRVSVLLYTEPLTPINELLSELLEALHERYPEGLPTLDPTATGDVQIPESTDNIALAIPVDENDATKGWNQLDLAEGGLLSTVKALGLKDGSNIAFAFGAPGQEPEFTAEFPQYSEEYEEEVEN